MADLTPAVEQMLHNYKAYPQLVVEITAQELHDSALQPGRFWQTAASYSDLQKHDAINVMQYLATRALRSKDGIPWATAQVGLMLPALETHPLWKYPHHRPIIQRILWDGIPHARNQAKYAADAPALVQPEEDTFTPTSSPHLTPVESLAQEHSPTIYSDDSQRTDAAPVATLICQLCQTGPDDLHHLLVECTQLELCAKRGEILHDLEVEYARKSAVLPPAVGVYLQHVFMCLRSPDPTRLSHGFWLTRPFSATTLELDRQMSHPAYDRSVLVPLTQLMLNVMRSLLEEVAPLWRRSRALLALQIGPTAAASRRRATRFRHRLPVDGQALPAKAARRSKPKVTPLLVRLVRTPSSTPGPPSDPTWPNFAIFSKSSPSEATAPMPQPPSHFKTRRIKSSAKRRLPAQLAGGLFPLFCRIPRTHSSSLGQGSPPLRLREMPLAPTTPTSSERQAGTIILIIWKRVVEGTGAPYGITER